MVILTETHLCRYLLRGYHNAWNIGESHSGGIQILSRGMEGGTRFEIIDSIWTLAIQFEEVLVIGVYAPQAGQ